MAARRGTFVALEGIDGSGKSGVARHLAAHLAARGVPVVQTREPGGTPEGEVLRGLLLSGAEEGWDPLSELLLMTAARIRHVQGVILPALAAGKTVLCDRYVGSTIAYQGAGRGIDEAFIRQLHAQAVGDVWPDLTLVLDVDAATGLARSRGRLAESAVDEGRFEALDLDFHERIRASYLDQATRDPAHHVVLDAAAPPERVCRAAVEALERHTAA